MISVAGRIPRNPQTMLTIRANISYRCLAAIEENHRQRPNILRED